MLDEPMEVSAWRLCAAHLERILNVVDDGNEVVRT
jgi:hypothetical protein